MIPVIPTLIPTMKISFFFPNRKEELCMDRSFGRLNYILRYHLLFELAWGLRRFEQEFGKLMLNTLVCKI
jgi:hypothetical protein